VPGTGATTEQEAMLSPANPPRTLPQLLPDADFQYQKWSHIAGPESGPQFRSYGKGCSRFCDTGRPWARDAGPENDPTMSAQNHIWNVLRVH